MDVTTYRKDRRYAPGHGYGAVVEGGPHYRASTAIRGLLLHTTNGNARSTLRGEAEFLRDSADVSAHYLIGQDGTTLQLLDETCIAWHAGVVREPAIFGNAASIGIEIHWTPALGRLPDAMRLAAAALCRDLIATHPALCWIDTHRNQALPPGRKVDPSGWSDADFLDWRAAVLRGTLPPITTPVLYTCVVDVANVRSQPNTTSTVVRTLKRGNQAPILETITVPSSTFRTWYRIGPSEYVWSELLRKA